MNRNQFSARRLTKRNTKPSASRGRALRDRFSIFELLENRTLLSTTYTVINNFDGGPGSLRDAITKANASPGLDTINFQLTGSSTISLSSALPAITDAVNIMGTTGAGGVPMVVLDGSGAAINANGLEVDTGGGGSTISGLSIVNFGGDGILVAATDGPTMITGDYVGVMPDLTVGANSEGVVLQSGGNTVRYSVLSGNSDAGIQILGDGNQILHNEIGTDAGGSIALGNGGNGVDAIGASHTLIRGNLISSNIGNGVRIRGGDLNTIAGNLIGTDATGEVAMGNLGNGVMLDTGASDTMVGGTAAGDRNILSGNNGSGVLVGDRAGTGNQIIGNYAGTDISGMIAVSNFADGVTISGNGVLVSHNLLSGNGGNGVTINGGGNTLTDNLLGTAADGVTPLPVPGGGFSEGIFILGDNNIIGTPGHGNVIAYNTDAGVSVFFGAGNAIRYNSIFGNGNIGIDLGADGPTPNDINGHDGTNNNYQDFPVILSMTNSGGVLTISGIAYGDLNATYTLDFYGTDSEQLGMYGQGRVYLGSMTVTTDSTGQIAFTTSINGGYTGQSFVVATATDAIGNTSEFSMAAAIPAAAQANADSSTTLTSDKTVIAIGDTIHFTANVVALSGTLAPTGSVSFYDMISGTPVLLGSGVLMSDGTATFSTSSLSLGNHSIVAVYNADPGFNTSQSAPLPEAVAQDFTTTLLSSTTTISTPGQAVTFTAVVSPGHNFSGSPTGTVTFFDNGVAIGTIALSGGSSVLTTTSLTVGTHVITAHYNGDTDFQGSTSNAVTETVKAPVILGSITGHTYSDKTGNGLSSDDAVLAGVTVKLYRDTNNNGVYDSGDAVAGSMVTGANGAYSFTGLSAGKYFVVETTPSGYIRTAPAVATYYTEVVNGNAYTNVDFDNFKKCDCASEMCNISYIINGCRTVTDLRGQTHEGDTVMVRFTVLAGHSETLSFVSYTAPGASFDANTASQQAVYNYQTGTFTAGSTNKTFTMTIKIPKCFYQIDFVCGALIDHFGPANSNIFYSAQSRLFSADNSGTHSAAGVTSIGGTVLS